MFCTAALGQTWCLVGRTLSTPVWGLGLPLMPWWRHPVWTNWFWPNARGSDKTNQLWQGIGTIHLHLAHATNHSWDQHACCESLHPGLCWRLCPVLTLPGTAGAHPPHTSPLLGCYCWWKPQWRCVGPRLCEEGGEASGDEAVWPEWRRERNGVSSASSSENSRALCRAPSTSKTVNSGPKSLKTLAKTPLHCAQMNLTPWAWHRASSRLASSRLASASTMTWGSRQAGAQALIICRLLALLYQQGRRATQHQNRASTH